MGADRGRPGRRRGGQLRRVPDGPGRAAGGARGQRRGGPQPAEGDHLQPELHDAVDDRGDGRAAPPSTSSRELVVASYQAASGAGQDGVDALLRPARRRWPATASSAPRRATSARRSATTSARSRRRWRSTSCRGPARCKDDGWSSEELKVRNESRKILGLPDLKVSATCVRVPVVTGHSLAVHARVRPEVDADGAREVLRDAPGRDRWSTTRPTASSRRRPTRSAPTRPGSAGSAGRWTTRSALDLFVSGDNLRKGAALNTAQIAEVVAKEFTAAKA